MCGGPQLGEKQYQENMTSKKEPRRMRLRVTNAKNDSLVTVIFKEL